MKERKEAVSNEFLVQFSPKGIFLSTTLVVAFHPEFLTKFDKVYKVQCFYMEMETVLEREITVKYVFAARCTDYTHLTS